MKNIIVKKDMPTKVVVVEIGDVEMNITFAPMENPGVKGSARKTVK